MTNQQNDHSKAKGILRYMLANRRASRRQVAWLIGYIDGLERKPQGG